MWPGTQFNHNPARLQFAKPGQRRPSGKANQLCDSSRSGRSLLPEHGENFLVDCVHSRFRDAPAENRYAEVRSQLFQLWLRQPTSSQAVFIR